MAANNAELARLAAAFKLNEANISDQVSKRKDKKAERKMTVEAAERKEKFDMDLAGVKSANA